MSLQLAPQHKVGLALGRPLLLANCTAELLSLCGRQYLGAVVAAEVGARRRRPRRIVERPGGLALEEGRGALSLSGLRQLLRVAGDLPVIGRVLAADVRGAAHAGARLASEGVSALQVDLLPGDPGLAEEVLGAVRRACDLPLLAQVPLLEAVPYARLCADLGVDALVVAAPPRGLAMAGDPSAPRPVEVHGPLLQPLFLMAVQEVAGAVDLPIVARGGLLTVADARAFLAQGAVAVALDTVATVEPSAVGEIGRALAGEAA